jgi:hypothetical protein
VCVGIVGVVIVFSGLGFLSYRLERASEPKAHAIKCSAWSQALDSFDFVQQ